MLQGGAIESEGWPDFSVIALSETWAVCLRAGRGRSRVMDRALKAGVIQDDDGRKNRLSYIYIMNWGTSEVLKLFLNIKC